MILITDDDIGKEGRFTWRGEPCIIIRRLRGWASPAFAIVHVSEYGSERAWTCRSDDPNLARVPAPPRKLYIGVRKRGSGGFHNTTSAYQTREVVEIAIIIGHCEAFDDYTIIEIPHPEDAP